MDLKNEGSSTRCLSLELQRFEDFNAKSLLFLLL